MNRLKGLCSAMVIATVLTAGCSTAVRYTQEEIHGYPSETQERIIKGEVVPGMTREQVRYSWGAPDMVNKLQPVNGKQQDEWVYSTMKVFKTTLIFIEGKLTYIISSEPGRLKKQER